MTEILLPISDPQGTDSEMLDLLLRETFDYFVHETTLQTGLVPDSTQPGSPVSVAVMGLTLSCYTVGVEHNLISRDEAIKRTLAVLRFFDRSPQGTEPTATGYQGFYYHFIDRHTGARAWGSEVSTIDTALFIAGVLQSAQYFNRDHAGDREIRELADALYRRINWQWALNGRATLSHGWKPECGFLPYHWDRGYNEALILYVLAMGSPTLGIGPEGYRQWTATYEIKELCGQRYAYAGPLFIHQMSQLWLGMKGLRDEFSQAAGWDYFENSRRATYAQRQYAIENPHGFAHYGPNGWGFTASDGPGPVELTVADHRRFFYGYVARGAPADIDDGTISPWAVVASLPFAPEIVICTIRHAIEKLNLKSKRRLYGFDASFNPTFPDQTHNPHGWVSPWRFGLNQGPIVMMIENHRSGLIWRTMGQSRYVVEGLKRAGFRAEPTAEASLPATPKG